METTIPFSGFYHSWHDQELDNALNYITSDCHGEVLSKKLFELAFDSINWKEVHLAYAKKYTELVADRFQLKIKFKMLCSPKYYNFETDRIIATIELPEVERIKSVITYSGLQAICKEDFTSRDGFISHYKNDYTLWPIDLEEWDHNQVGTLLQAYIKEHENYTEDWELSLLEDLSETAYSLVSNAITGRASKLLNYFIERENRA